MRCIAAFPGRVLVKPGNVVSAIMIASFVSGGVGCAAGGASRQLSYLLAENCEIARGCYVGVAARARDELPLTPR